MARKKQEPEPEPIIEDDDDYGTDLNVNDAIAYPRERTPFSQEDLINAHLLRTTDLIKYLEDFIDQAFFTPETARRLKVIVNNYLSKVAVLANFESRNVKDEWGSHSFDEIKKVELGLAIELGSRICDMYKPDYNSDLMALADCLQSHFFMLISRARGKDREGIINRKVITEHVQKSLNVTGTQKVKPSRFTLRGKE